MPPLRALWSKRQGLIYWSLHSLCLFLQELVYEWLFHKMLKINSISFCTSWECRKIKCIISPRNVVNRAQSLLQRHSWLDIVFYMLVENCTTLIYTISPSVAGRLTDIYTEDHWLNTNSWWLWQIRTILFLPDSCVVPTSQWHLESFLTHLNILVIGKRLTRSANVAY